MNKFDQYKLSLTDKQKKMVNDYLLKIKNFIEKHEIDTDLYNDIEEMVFEKLSLEKEITDLRVVKILQEVGEPEIIFSDFVETTSSDSSEPFYEKLQKTGWVRNNEGALFLGISHTLAKKIGISVLAVRILLLILFLPLGISAWLYILAGILLPVVGVDYTGKTNLGYFKTQIILVVRNAVYNLSASFMKLIAYFGKFGWTSVKEIVSFIVKNIFPVLRFIIFGCIAFFLSLGVLGLLSVGSVYFTHFSLENIDFVASLPNYFIYGIGAGAFALFVFALASIIYAISKKVINGYLFLLGGISFLVAIFLGISTGLDMIQKYSATSQYTQSAQVEVGNTGSYILDMRKLSEMNDIELEFFGLNAIALEHSTGSVLEVQVKNTIRGNSEIYNKITQNLSEISFTKSDARLELAPKNNRIFSQNVPFTLITRDIVVKVPDGVKIAVLNNDRYYFENAFVSNTYEKYSNFLRNDCRNAEIWYDAKSEQFNCDVSEEELIGAKQEYLKQYLVEHFDEVSPIHHKEVFKRSYYGDYGRVSDWSFPRIEFAATGSEVMLQFGDRSLDIDARLSMEETQSGVIMKDFKIENVQVDMYQFDEKYYKGVDAIQSYITQE